MNIEIIDSIVYIQSQGYFNQELGQKVLKESLDQINQGKTHFLVDMSESKMVNSIGISMLIEIIEKLQEIDGKLAFCTLAPVVDKTFKIMGIAKYANIYSTNEEGLKALQ
jgi:anti-sigma B factor antagonist